MGMFDNIENAKAAASGGAYIRPGHYLFRVDRVKAGKSQQDGTEYVAIEMTTIKTFEDGELPKDEDFNVLSKENWHKSGEPVSHVLQAKHPSFQSNFKALVANVGGIAESEVTKEHCEAVTNGLFEGLIVDVRARTVKTKRGRPFTAVAYTREVPPSDVAEIVDRETLDRVLGPNKIDELIAAEQEG